MEILYLDDALMTITGGATAKKAKKKAAKKGKKSTSGSKSKASASSGALYDPEGREKTQGFGEIDDDTL